MDPLETLSNEHGLIRQFLDNLALAAQKIEEGQRPSRAFFEKAIDFARSFADTYHHFKEEHVLFVQLAQKQQGEIDAQLEALRYQHERGRELITGMATALDGYVERDPNRTADLLENMAAYVSLLRHHIHNEDHVFYPLARNTMTQEEFAKLTELFEAEREKHGADTFELSHKKVSDMGSILVHLRPPAA
jgi:hemerythrin-like domain-containing protein